jgi:CHAD domain-containing protein
MIMRTNGSLTTALFLSASIAVLSLTMAERSEAQDVKPQQQHTARPLAKTTAKLASRTAKSRLEYRQVSQPAIVQSERWHRHRSVRLRGERDDPRRPPWL